MKFKFRTGHVARTGRLINFEKVEVQKQEKCNFGGKNCVVGEFECQYSE